MMTLDSGDFVFITIAVLVLAGVIGGMVKFARALAILRKGRPEIDPLLLEEHEAELKKQEEDSETTAQ